MDKLLHLIRLRLKQRPDSELQQALIRLGIVIICYVYFSSPWFSHAEEIIATAQFVFIPITIVSVALVVLPLYDPGPSILRRGSGMLHDFFVTSYMLIVAGPTGVPLTGLYLWVTIGNGFRYGMPYLIACTFATVVGFSVVYNLSAFWKANPYLWWGLLVSLVSIPVYASTLLRELQRAVRSANEANNAKSIFLANMSHDLRTPLNGVIGVTDLLTETDLKSNQRDLVRVVHSSSTRLLEVIDNILDISRIESGKLDITNEDFDLHELIRNVISAVDGQARKKKLQLNLNISPSVPFKLNGDRRHLHQVLVNLIGKAIKFTESGWVDLNISLAEPAVSSLIRFEIVDSGTGTSSRAPRKLFDVVTLADPLTPRRLDGTGLGTTIAKNLVTSMGGEISMENEPGKGSRSWFDLPFLVIEEGHISKFSSTIRVAVLAGTRNLFRIAQVVRQIGGEDLVLSTASHLNRDFLTRERIDVVLVDDSILPGGPVEFINSISEFRKEDLPPLILSVTAERLIDESAVIHAGYSSVLREPLSDNLLFNALHATISHPTEYEPLLLCARYHEKSSGTGPARILVAEDNPVNRRVIYEVLSNMGHQVALVNDGEEALNKLGSERFDLAIMDMHMPHMSGPEAVKRWRFMESGHLPMIMLTADTNTMAEAEALEAGFDAILTKPVKGIEICDLIADLISQSQKSVAPHSEQKTEVPMDGALDESVLIGIAQLGGNTLVREIMDFFREDGVRCLKKARRALFTRDQALWRDQLLTLKGGAHDIGARKLAHLCASAEKLILIHDDRSEATKKLDEIRSALTESQFEMQAYIQRNF